MFKKLALAAAVGTAALAATPSYAAVTFNTNASTLALGSSSCTGGGLSVNCGGITLTYNPISSTTALNPSNVNFGSLTTACVGTCNSLQSLAGLVLNLVITQTAPTPGSGSLPSGILSGGVLTNGSNAQITFGAGSLSIGNVTYAITNNPLDIVPPTSGVNGDPTAGTTTIQGIVREVPEPSTWLMMMAGFGALGFALRRQKAATRRVNFNFA